MSDFRRIAAEEAFTTPEILERYKELLRKPGVDTGFASLWGHFSNNATVVGRLLDLGGQRIRDMDEAGIAMQVLSLTAPGVQVFDADEAVALARSSNDQLAEAVREYPTRFAGLAAVAPQNPAEAANELERGVRRLGLKGAIINSHTRGEYLDDSKFWPIFEAAESLGVPVYLHPTALPPSMVQPFVERGLEGAVYGFAAETGLHILRIVLAGVFDRFPKLQMVAGHLGEGLPFWLFRVDFMHKAMVKAERYAGVKRLKRQPSEYLRDNFHVTTSGMAWEPAILYTQSVLGVDRVLYAMDYPYQFVPAEVRVTDDLPIGDGDKKKLYQLNAKRVFSLCD
jgi:2,3-dihydroxybenzoate decarboxylase